MASLGKNRGPYSLDYNQVLHRDVTTTTILNTPKFDSMLSNLGDAYEYEVGYVPAGYEHRPDLIANVFYGSPKNWWLLMLVNGISDPAEGFVPNQRIIIPKL
jgi:hypothetical protein|tara:strand:+ start:3376 stop:3681 length:306 start_codon:yes stop_codon:yes gene_type:complete